MLKTKGAEAVRRLLLKFEDRLIMSSPSPRYGFPADFTASVPSYGSYCEAPKLSHNDIQDLLSKPMSWSSKFGACVEAYRALCKFGRFHIPDEIIPAVTLHNLILDAQMGRTIKRYNKYTYTSRFALVCILSHNEPTLHRMQGFPNLLPVIPSDSLLASCLLQHAHETPNSACLLYTSPSPRD